MPGRVAAMLGVARGGSAVRVGAAARGWDGGAGGAGRARVQARGLSSYLADAVRENAANHCIERVVNGSLDAAVVVVSCLTNALLICHAYVKQIMI